jgi:HK97 family phage major capsid protein/HK97 family phage prohead protease
MRDRAYSILHVRDVNDDARVIEGIASTPATDRVGDIVEPMGAKFALPMPLLWQHDAWQPVGHVEFAKPTKNGIPFRATIANIAEPGKLRDRVEEAWQSVKAGLVRAVSIGFRSLEHEFMEGGGIRFRTWEWLELSLVTIPANADATITTVRSIDAELRAATGRGRKSGVFALPGSITTTDDRLMRSVGTTLPGASGSLKTNAKKGAKAMPRTIAEQITAFENTRAAKAARMADIMNEAGEQDVTLDTEQADEYDGLRDDLKEIDAHLGRLREQEALQAVTAKPPRVDATERGMADRAQSPITIVRETKLPPGIEFARYVKALAAAKGNPQIAYEIAKAQYPDNGRVHNVLKAAVAAGTTTDPTWAGPLVDYQTFAGDFIEFLRPTTILGKFGANGIPSLFNVPFNIKIPAQTSGGSAYWVGEGKPKPLTKFDFSQIELRWAKIASIAVLTEELVRFSNPSADTLVRNALAEAVRARMDIDFIDPAKAVVANVSPASITNGVTPIASTGDVSADLDALYTEFITANLSTASGVFIMSEITAQQIARVKTPLGQSEYPNIGPRGGSLEGVPVITSQYVPVGTIILVAADQVYLADDGQVVIDASREASLEMLDNPTNASAPPTATSLVSLWQTNSIGIKAERFVNWQKRRAEAVAMVTGADYAPTT